MRAAAPIVMALALTGCGTTAYWQGADGSKGGVRLGGEYGVLTQESYAGSAGVLFGGGTNPDGTLSRGRTWQQSQAEGPPFELHVGPDGITVTAATVSHAPATRAGANALQDIEANAAAAKLGGKIIDGAMDLGVTGIKAATR